MSGNGSHDHGALASAPPGHLSIRRLERMADLIFAIALVLLLITIDFAPEDSATAEEAYAYFYDQIAQSLGFVISFVIIGYYWITHQEYFSYYTGTNKVHTLIELLFLMTIAGMPFNNHFIAVCPMEVAPRVAISMDIVAAGMLSFLSWSYATAGHRLVDPRTAIPEVVNFMRPQAFVMPLVALIVLAGAFVHPFVWDGVLTAGPLAAPGFGSGKKA